MKRRVMFRLAGLMMCAGLLGRAEAQKLSPVIGTLQRPVVETASGGQMIANEILVRVRTGKVSPEFARLGTVQAIGTGTPFIKIRLRAGITVANALSQARRMGEVECASPNFLRAALVAANDPEYLANRQYALPLMQLTQAWNFWKPCKQVIVGVVDTGIKSDHADLTNMMIRDTAGNVLGYDAVENQAYVGESTDPHGHGTFCAGEANAQTNNGTGVASFAFTGAAGTSETYALKLMPLRMLDAGGYGEDADLVECIYWGLQHGVNVFSMSIGGADASETLNAAAQDVWNAGALIVAAAGNGNTSVLSYPGACPQVLSVAATNDTDQFAGFSNYGSWVNLAAPGVSIRSTTNGGSYGYSSGTSMACPLVAGMAAFLWSQNPTLNNTAICSAILTTTDALPAGQTKTIQNGRVNVRSAQVAVKYPPLSGKVLLPGWLKPDTTPYRTGNLVRVFVFPANSTPTQESQALAFADVPLDERGVYALPSGVAADGTYRIGIKPLTAPGLAVLLPGNVALSAVAPPVVPDVSVRLGDATRDGVININDLLALLARYNEFVGSVNYDAAADINGDGGNDISDLMLIIASYNQFADFLP